MYTDCYRLNDERSSVETIPIIPFKTKCLCKHGLHNYNIYLLFYYFTVSVI